MAQYREDRETLLIISVIPDGLDVGYLPKKPSEFFKKLTEVCTPVRFEVSTPAKLYAWAARHLQHENITASEDTVRFLVEYCGRSMYALSFEIGKLCAFLHAHGRTEATREDIQYVTVPEEECDGFALSNALMSGDRASALSVLGIMKFRQIKPERVMYEIAELYSNLYQTKLLMGAGLNQTDIAKTLSRPQKRIHDYTAGLYMKAVARVPEAALVRAIELCSEADVAMKSYSRRDYEQVERLICLL